MTEYEECSHFTGEEIEAEKGIHLMDSGFESKSV